MNHKMVTLLIVVQLVTSIAPRKLTVGNIYVNFEYDCNLILSLMNFHYNQRCVQLIFGHGLYSVECIKTIIENSQNVTFYIRSMTWLLNRNIYVEELSANIMNEPSTKSCENFLFVLKDIYSLQRVLDSLKNNVSVVTLFPYTKLYFMFVDKIIETMPPQMLNEISKFLYENAHFGYAYEFDASKSTIKLRDFLSLPIENPIQSNLIHPIVDRENDQKVFGISFYHCYPFIIYVDEESLSFDGIEYRLVREVTKNWKINYILRDESKTGITPWITMFNDLRNRIADLAMCSIWTSDFDEKYDVSAYYNHECNTLMIPKPKRLSEITAIYTTLSGEVWLTFGLFFFATGLLLRSSSMITIIKMKRTYGNMSEIFLDVMNVATSHGVNSFWQHQSSTQVLLMSWILVSFLVGTFYTTIYTSRLTKPGYTKVINTIEDFIEEDMFWGTYHAYADIKKSLNASSISAYHELNDRILVFKNANEAESGLASGKFGVYAGITNSKYFVTYDWNEQLNKLSTFRLMKEICIFNHYTVFALQKFSPYTELFSHYALKFQEFGIAQFWFRTVYRNQSWMNTFFEKYPKESNEPVALHFSSISGALLILFVSHIFSIVVFTFELMVKHFIRNRRLL